MSEPITPDELRELQRLRERADEAYAILRRLSSDLEGWGERAFTDDLMDEAAAEVETALSSLHDALRFIEKVSERGE